MEKKNYLLLAVGFSTLLTAGCGPSIEDAQRHAEKSAEESEIAVSALSTDLVDKNQSPAAKIVTDNNHIAEIEPGVSVASVDDTKADDSELEANHVISHDGEHKEDVVPEQIHTDDELAAESEKQRMLDKISVLRDRLQHARTSKEEAVTSIQQIHSLLSNNEAEMETLLSALDNVEQSVQQLDQEINEIATEVASEELSLVSESIMIEEGVLDDVVPSEVEVLVEDNAANTVSE